MMLTTNGANSSEMYEIESNVITAAPFNKKKYLSAQLVPLLFYIIFSKTWRNIPGLLVGVAYFDAIGFPSP